MSEDKSCKLSDTIPLTSVLSISGPKIDCNSITKQLCDAGIVCHVETNQSVRCENVDGKRECWIEPGCSITSTVRTKTDSLAVWRCLKSNSLQCAHIKVDSKFSGCVLDWSRDSLCR